MNLQTLLKIFADKDCRKIYVKRLAANDNSKNQVYFGGSFDILNILPIKEITSHDPGDWKRARFKTKLDFSWVNGEGELSVAPDAQLILYPKYPEVRFSGFLNHSKNAPSELMANRIEGRLLFSGITKDEKIIGHVVDPDSEISKEFDNLKGLQIVGVFKEITIVGNNIELNSKQKLISELKRIHNLGWIDSKRLRAIGDLIPCQSSNCGGYTLEAELNIPSNPNSAPDYLGWELKNFSVNNFERINSSVLSLMDHSPSSGFFNEFGAQEFIRKFGYDDKLGREARLNFGGIHKYEILHALTSLKLIIQGFDMNEGKIINTDGYVALIDGKENIAASWSFASIIKHWNRKHSKACYVPSKLRKINVGDVHQQYSYGNKIIMGNATDVTLFLKQLSLGKVYYDPGMKLELEIEGIRKQNTKVRSLFRIKSGDLPLLYKTNEIVDLDLIQ